MWVGEGDEDWVAAPAPFNPALFGNPPPTPGVTPDRILRDGEVLELGALRFRLLATPGHSPGCMVALEEAEGDAFVGDLIFAQGIGRTDFPRSDPGAMLRSLERVFAEVPRATRIHPGHGPWGVTLGRGGALRQDVHVSAAPDRDAVLRVLRDVHDPELHRSIVDLGMVGDVEVREGRVLVAIRLTVAGCPLKAEIQRRVTEALAPLPGIETIQVTMDAMTDEERKRLRPGLITGEERPSPFQPGSRTTVIGVASGKGGVGKSSITANLALVLAEGGATVGLLDADVYGYSIPRMMGVTRPAVAVDDLMMPVEAHGVRMMSIGFLTEEDSPVIWRGPMLHKALTSFITEVWWDDPDYLLVDLPPGTGDVALSLSRAPADRVVRDRHDPPARRPARRAPGRRDGRAGEPAGGGRDREHELVRGARHRRPLRGLLRRRRASCSRPSSGVPLLGRIPLEPAVARAGDAGLPVVASAPESPAARALRGAAERLLAVVPRPVARALLTPGPLVASLFRGTRPDHPADAVVHDARGTLNGLHHHGALHRHEGHLLRRRLSRSTASTPPRARRGTTRRRCSTSTPPSASTATRASRPARWTRRWRRTTSPDKWDVFKEINRVYFEEGPAAGEKMVADYLSSKA